MSKIPIIELAAECLSIRLFRGKIGLDIHWGEYGTGMELFAFGIGEMEINFIPLPNFDEED